MSPTLFENRRRSFTRSVDADTLIGALILGLAAVWLIKAELAVKRRENRLFKFTKQIDRLEDAIVFSATTSKRDF